MALIFNGQFMGKSDSRWSGYRGSFAETIGIDGHSQPGTITAHQALALNSGATVTGLPLNAVAVSTGETFWFSRDSGAIWRRATDGTWLLVYTTTPAAGAAICLGAMEFNGFLYWATQSRLHRISMALAHATAANWTANAVPDYATFAITDADYHPMAIQDIDLFIGDGNRVTSVNSAGTFNNNVLDLPSQYRVSALIDYDIDLLIGTIIATTVNRAEIFRWDTVSPSWNSSDPINEAGINAFIRDDNYLYVSAGRAGNIYYYNGQYLVPHKKIPGTYTSTQTGIIYPGSVANFRGIPVFGFSNVAGNPAPQGVYSFGSYSKEYPKVLDLSFPISERSAGALVTSGLEIGAILAVGLDLLVAWRNGASYGVDLLDYSNKLTLAYFDSRMLFEDQRDVLKTLANVSAYYDSLPANTGITFSYRINGGAFVAMTSVTDSILNAVRAQLSVDGAGSLQIRCAFTVSVNSAPVIEKIGVDLE